MLNMDETCRGAGIEALLNIISYSGAGIREENQSWNRNIFPFRKILEPLRSLQYEARWQSIFETWIYG